MFFPLPHNVFPLIAVLQNGMKKIAVMGKIPTAPFDKPGQKQRENENQNPAVATIAGSEDTPKRLHKHGNDFLLPNPANNAPATTILLSSI